LQWLTPGSLFSHIKRILKGFCASRHKSAVFTILQNKITPIYFTIDYRAVTSGYETVIVCSHEIPFIVAKFFRIAISNGIRF
jgi:hypothetical protein